MGEQKDSGSFLNRWSSRKQQSTRQVPGSGAGPGPGHESDLPDSAGSAELPVAVDRSANAPAADETALKRMGAPGKGSEALNAGLAPVEDIPPVLTDADMPDIESLTMNSDISGFFSSGVSAALRKSALRHVFRQPGYNVRDGLDDYDDDYTSFTPLGDTVTSDMKFHTARRERARLEQVRLAQEQDLMQSGETGNVEINQDDNSTLQNELPPEHAEEGNAVSAQDAQGMHDDAHAHSQSALETPEEQVATEANPASDQPPEHNTDSNNPLNKASQANALPPCETPDE